MNIYHSLHEFKTLTNAVVTGGTFDGMHIGHQAILSRLQSIAQQIHGETVVYTFWPHPRMVLQPHTHIKLLSTMEERMELFQRYGINHVLQIPFTENFYQLTATEFVSEVLVRVIGTKKLVIGYDHHFGKNREGNFEQLKNMTHQFNFDVEEIPPQDIDHVTISSTKIRNALASHQVDVATQWLGRPYSIRGQVIQGNHVGHQIGFPTANLQVDSSHKLIPADGVYVVSASLKNHTYQGMLNIGNRPTFENQTRAMEVHIFNFNQSIYGQEVVIYVHHFLRNEIKFENIDMLTNQLKIDQQQALHYFQQHL